MKLLSRPLLSAIFTSAMAGYLLAIFMAYLGIHLENLGAVAFLIGVVFFSRNFFQIFLRVPFGELAQIVGRKPLITLGTLCYVIAFALMYLANSWVLVLIATFVVAVGMSLYYPAMFSYIGDIAEGDYGKINGYIFQGGDIGVILGTFLSSYLLRHEIVDLNGLFLVGAGIGTIGVIIIHFVLSEVLDPESKRDVDSIPLALFASFRDSLGALKKMTQEAPFGRIYVFQFVISFTEYFTKSFFPLIVVLYLQYSKSTVSDIILITTLSIFFIKPYLGSISDKYGFRTPVLIALTINAISLALLTQTSNLVVVIILYAVIVSSSLTSYFAVNGATSNAAGASSRGLALGALGFWVSFGRSTSSLVLTPIWNWYEVTTGNKGLAVRNIFLVASAIILFAVIVLTYISRDIEVKPPSDRQAELELQSNIKA